MFVSRAKYDAAQAEIISTRLDYMKLQLEWNELVRRINLKGGEAFLNGDTKNQFTQEEIKALIRLCHPDRHNGSEASIKITQKLLKLRK